MQCFLLILGHAVKCFMTMIVLAEESASNSFGEKCSNLDVSVMSLAAEL